MSPRLTRLGDALLLACALAVLLLGQLIDAVRKRHRLPPEREVP